MGSLEVQLLGLANRLLPAPSLPGDADPMEYAQWEYDTSSAAVELLGRCEGPVRRALDVGCGLGGKTLRLRESGDPDVEWWGLDIEEDHLHGARDFHRQKAVEPPKLVRADAARLPYADGVFDRVVSADALEHFPEPRRTLRELRRVLDDQGRLVLLFNPWLSPRGSHLGDLLHLPWCQAFFSRETLVEATQAEAERRARRAKTPEQTQRIREHGESLVQHFLHHVHPTHVRDLRHWLQRDATFAIESEALIGPGPLARLPQGVLRLGEEWFSATYGAVLRPLSRGDHAE